MQAGDAQSCSISPMQKRGRYGRLARMEKISANWPRLAEAGGRPELDLALAGRAGGRIGQRLVPIGIDTASVECELTLTGGADLHHHDRHRGEAAPCVETKVAQRPRPNSSFDTPRQRQIKLRAASSLGQPWPIGRDALAGRPYRPWYHARRVSHIGVRTRKATLPLTSPHRRTDKGVSALGQLLSFQSWEPP